MCIFSIHKDICWGAGNEKILLNRNNDQIFSLPYMHTYGVPKQVFFLSKFCSVLRRRIPKVVLFLAYILLSLAKTIFFLISLFLCSSIAIIHFLSHLYTNYRCVSLNSLPLSILWANSQCFLVHLFPCDFREILYWQYYVFSSLFSLYIQYNMYILYKRPCCFDFGFQCIISYRKPTFLKKATQTDLIA